MHSPKTTTMSNIKTVIGNLSIQTIPENALLHGVVQALAGREAFNDADPTNIERFYHGDVFEVIASEQAEMGASPIRIKDQKVIDQLEELAELISADYVLITNT